MANGDTGHEQQQTEVLAREISTVPGRSCKPCQSKRLVGPPNKGGCDGNTPCNHCRDYFHEQKCDISEMSDAQALHHQVKAAQNEPPGTAKRPARLAQPKAQPGQIAPVFEQRLLDEPLRALPRFEPIQTSAMRAKADKAATHAPRLPARLPPRLPSRLPPPPPPPPVRLSGGLSRPITVAEDVQLEVEWTVSNSSGTPSSMYSAIMQEATDAFYATVDRKMMEQGLASTSVIGVKREADQDDSEKAGSSKRQRQSKSIKQEPDW